LKTYYSVWGLIKFERKITVTATVGTGNISVAAFTSLVGFEYEKFADNTATMIPPLLPPLL